MTISETTPVTLESVPPALRAMVRGAVHGLGDAGYATPGFNFRFSPRHQVHHP